MENIEKVIEAIQVMINKEVERQLSLYLNKPTTEELKSLNQLYPEIAMALAIVTELTDEREGMVDEYLKRRRVTKDEALQQIKSHLSNACDIVTTELGE